MKIDKKIPNFSNPKSEVNLFWGISFFSLVFLMLFFFWKIDYVKAADSTSTTGACIITCGFQASIGDEPQDTETTKQNGLTQKACDDLKTSLNESHLKEPGAIACGEQWEAGKTLDQISAVNGGEKAAPGASPVKAIADTALKAITYLLTEILRLMGWLVSLAGVLFAWVADANKLNEILANSSVYAIWVIVRDLFNIAFILVLLFSAFCTIFQIASYSYKKILLTLVLMALLVNFSYPISRFIVDVSNVTMYSLFKASFSSAKTPTEIYTKMVSQTSLDTIVKPTGDPSITQLLASIIFVFILAITLLTLAVLLVIRAIALIMLIAFSSIGFVGNIVPFLNKYASDWWDTLFKYAFFGPVMAIMIYVAIQFMSITINISLNDGSVDQSVITAMARFTVPIIILWMGMGIAQKMSIHGAGAVTGKAQKFISKAGGWSARQFSGYNWGRNVYDKYQDERKKRKAILDQTAWSSKIGKFAGSKPGELRDKAQSHLRRKGSGQGREGGDKFYTNAIIGSKDAQTRMAETIKRDIAEIRKNWRDTGVSMEELEKALSGGNTATKRAAALEMAEKKGFGENAQANYKQARMAVEGDNISKELFNDKVKEKNIKLLIDYEIATNPSQDPLQIYDKYIGKMNTDQLSKQKGILSDTNQLSNGGYFKEKAQKDPKFVEELAKKMSQNDRQTWIDKGMIQNAQNNAEPQRRAGFI